ncbi:hypothetical protein CBL_21111 [Carabus blaptoides fortunei]
MISSAVGHAENLATAELSAMKRKTVAIHRRRETKSSRPSEALSLLAAGAAEGVRCRMVIDTGANATLIHPRIIRQATQLRDTGAPVRNLELKTVTGERAPIIEQREVNLRVGNMLVVHTVYVAEIEDDVILGIDFLRKYGCVIDPVNNLLRFGEEEVMLEDRTEDCTIRCRLMSLADITVPPMAEILVPAATTCSANSSEHR